MLRFAYRVVSGPRQDEEFCTLLCARNAGVDQSPRVLQAFDLEAPKIRLEITAPEQIRALELLAKTFGDESTAQDAALFIIYGFIDGVVRPGSWERECVERFFGDGWTESDECRELIAAHYAPRASTERR